MRIELALNVDFIIRHLAEIVGKFVYFPAKSRDILRIKRKPDRHGMTASVCEKIRTGKNSVTKRKSSTLLPEPFAISPSFEMTIAGLP